MAWRRPGDKPLSEPMMVSLLTHICVTRPQRVKIRRTRLWVTLEDDTATSLFDLMFLSLRGGINSLHNLERKNATDDDVEHTRSWRHNGNAHNLLNGGMILGKRFIPYVNIAMKRLWLSLVGYHWIPQKCFVYVLSCLQIMTHLWYSLLYSLAPGKCGSNFTNAMYEHMLRIKSDTACNVDLMGMPKNTFDDKSTFGQVMVWCLQASSHCLRQCRLQSTLGYNELHIALKAWRAFRFFAGFSVQVSSSAPSHYLNHYFFIM